MRQSQKAWVWSSIPAYTAGSFNEASACAKGGADPQEPAELKGKRRTLVPRT